MSQNAFTIKRQNAKWQRLTFNRRIVFPVSLFVLLAVCLSIRASFPIILEAGSSAAKPLRADDWRSCNRDAVCCARLLSPAKRPHLVVKALVRLPSGREITWPMAVHRDSDIVSGDIQRTGTWDGGKTLAILNALRGAGKGTRLFDVGANIGWFTMSSATAGYSVTAVEPFAENLALLRHSLCLAERDVSDRVVVLPYALGNRDGMQCGLWQRALYNRGDTFTVCDGASKQSPASMREAGFMQLGNAHVRRLDVMVANREVAFQENGNIIMKIDVEGFEPMAMEGAREFLAKYQPRIIFSEYGEKLIRRAAQTMGASLAQAEESPKKFLDYMTNAGYSHSIQGGGTDPFWGLIQEAIFTRIK